MKKLMPQLKIHPVALTAIMGLMLFFGNSMFLSSAADAPAAAPMAGSGTVPYPFQEPNPQETNNLCEPYMKDFAAKELADFRTFMETTFQNKSSTASLLEVAMGKYRELRTELNTAYAKYYPNIGSLQLRTGIEPSKCKQIIDTTLADARVLLKNHATRTSGVKKSTALIQKYQQINAELANLFQQFVYLKSYLDTFSGKLPCYPKTGCVKG